MWKMFLFLPFALLLSITLYFGFFGVAIKNVMIEKERPINQIPS